MKILVINTALNLSFISLVVDGAQTTKTFPFQNTSENLLPEIDKLLKKCKTKVGEIDAVSVCIGPGSFTGIRVGIATAKALSIALGTSLIFYSAFDLFPAKKTCLTKANSGGAYARVVGEVKFLEKAEKEKLNNKQVYVFEEEKDYFSDFAKAKTVNLIAESLALSTKLFNGKKFCKASELIPLYIQKSQAENELISNINNSKITQVSQKDIDKICEIEKECFDKPYSKEVLLKELENESKRMFAIEVKGTLAGYVLYSAMGEEMELERICIIKKYRGLGLSKKLISGSINLFGAKKCFLEVNKKNEVAINLYSKLGFVKSGERKNYYGAGQDAVLMTKVF